MVKLPEEGKKGQMVRFKGPAGEELITDGALGTFVSDVLAGKIAAHRFVESRALAGKIRAISMSSIYTSAVCTDESSAH